MEKIQRAFKIRIYPTQEQEVLINKTTGCCRFIYNQMLAERQKVFNEWKESGKDQRTLYEHKYKTEKEYKQEYEWLKEVDSTALQQARRNLSNAYSNFFKSLKGTRKGEKVGFPKFHKKSNNESYRTVMNIYCNFDERTLQIPKLGKVKFRHRTGEKSWYRTARLINITVRKAPSGKFFASCLFEGDQDFTGIPTKIKTVKGLDCSMQNFYVDEQGNSPNFQRNYRLLEHKLAHESKALSRKSSGGANWNKQRIRVARIHERIANKRRDFVDQLSWKLIQENDCIVVENLNLKGMAQALNLGKSVNDLGYSMFVSKLIYKAKWNDKTVILADRWFASSKICHVCGFKNKDLMLHEREWTCFNCSTKHNRDQNAAINLKQLVNTAGCAVNAYGCEQVTAAREVGKSPVFSG